MGLARLRIEPWIKDHRAIVKELSADEALPSKCRKSGACRAALARAQLVQRNDAYAIDQATRICSLKGGRSKSLRVETCRKRYRRNPALAREFIDADGQLLQSTNQILEKFRSLEQRERQQPQVGPVQLQAPSQPMPEAEVAESAQSSR